MRHSTMLATAAFATLLATSAFAADLPGKGITVKPAQSTISEESALFGDSALSGLHRNPFTRQVGGEGAGGEQGGKGGGGQHRTMSHGGSSYCLTGRAASGHGGDRDPGDYS